ANDDLKPVAPQPRFDAKGPARSKAQIDIIPEHRGITRLSGARARNDAAVGMALDNLKSGIECRLIKSVRELAQAAADTPDETAFAQFAALDKAAAPRRAANLF